MNYDERRKFTRFKVKNGSCMLQVPETRKVFCASVLDISQGGMSLKLDVDPDVLKIASELRKLEILSYSSLEEITFAISNRVTQVVWQEHKMLGCRFIDQA